MAKAYRCDRCDTIHDGKTFGNIKALRGVHKTLTEQGGSTTNLDYCEACAKAFKEFHEYGPIIRLTEDHLAVDGDIQPHESGVAE